MKLVRRISFLLVLSGVMLGLGGYGALKAEEFFYPNKYQNRDKHVQTPKVTNTAQEEWPEEQVIEAAVEEKPVVTADTLYLVETVDLSEGKVDEKEESMPVRYIGLDREELLEELSFYDSNPPLTELELGFESIVVYEEDKQTLYMNTDILLESLDDALQAQIICGKYVENEEALYRFLESYSS